MWLVAVESLEYTVHTYRMRCVGVLCSDLSVRGGGGMIRSGYMYSIM